MKIHWFPDGMMVQNENRYDRWTGKTTGKSITLTCGLQELTGSRKEIEEQLAIQNNDIMTTTGMRFR